MPMSNILLIRRAPILGNTKVNIAIALFLTLFLSNPIKAKEKPKIAVFSGPTATIQNNRPLVTSNKAREQYNLPPLRDEWGDVTMDWPRYQRLAAPVTVYIEMFSAHPLESDVKELYAAPDGYINKNGLFSADKSSEDDTPVYAVTLRPEDGLYALPYMGRQADGSAWNGVASSPDAPFEKSRQTFVPDASRIFEEIERDGGEIYRKASYHFYRAVPAGGYTKGLAQEKRTDEGTGDIPNERLGEDFFTYGPYGAAQGRSKLATAVNYVQKALNSGDYAGAIWLEGSPSIENTSYWLSLMVDSELPISANAAHRTRGYISADGDGNILQSVNYILSNVWGDEFGRNQLGAVMVQDDVIYSSREIQKGDARPGGYVVTGGYGGIFGAMTSGGFLTNVPALKHTWKSDVRISVLPDMIEGRVKQAGKFNSVSVKIKDSSGDLLPSAIPKVAILKGARWFDDDGGPDPSKELGIQAQIEHLLTYPLAGIVGEGNSPYSGMSASQDKALEKAALNGLPVVKTGRGDATGFVNVRPNNLFIEGNNLTSTKARILLTAAIMKLGPLPIAVDPDNPTDQDLKAIRAKIAEYQDIFQTH